MLPTKSNLLSDNCSPLSSNCIIWQGPCLSCININTGDTISEVIHELATQLCSISDTIGLSAVDLKCLFDISSGTPQPEKTLVNILNLIITEVCTLADIIGDGGGDTPVVDNIIVATCFQTLDNQGDPIISLPIDDYVRAIGNKVCTIFSTVTSHTGTLTSYGTRITNLENSQTTPTVLPTFTPTCSYNGDTSTKTLSQFLTNLEGQFCTLKTATGTPTELIQATSKQCAGLNTSPALSVSGNMSGISGWKTTVSTVADSLNNMWLTICDMRSAVIAVKECCSKTCADITIDYIATISDNGATVKLYFSGYTILPSEFDNCSVGGNKLTVTDGVGGSYVRYIDLPAVANSSDPVSIDIASTPLNPTGTYTFTLDSCVTDGTLICNKTVVKNATGSPLSCSIPSNVTVTLS